jgi:hypothetical protein
VLAAVVEEGDREVAGAVLGVIGSVTAVNS